MDNLRIDAQKGREAIHQSFTSLINLAKEKASKIPFHILILSGKGGVGKSFIAISVAHLLSKRGLRVLLYDADEVGSSVSYVLGALGAAALIIQRSRDNKITLIPPDKSENFHFLSVEQFLSETGAPLLWEGGMRSRFIIETMSSVSLDTYDIVVYDLPAGTGDEIITIAQLLEKKAAIIVSAPGKISEKVVRKAINFCKKLEIPIAAIVENMSYFVCPSGKRFNLFGESALDKLATEYGIRLFMRLPFDMKVRESMDKGRLVELLLSEENEISVKLNQLTESLLKFFRFSSIT